MDYSHITCCGATFNSKLLASAEVVDDISVRRTNTNFFKEKIMWTKLWSWTEKNRFTVVAPLIILLLWLVAVGCMPETKSPLTGLPTNASELSLDYAKSVKAHEIMLQSFEVAGEDLERQVAAQNELKQLLLALASGSVASWPGLLQMLVGGGLLGLASDAIRKNGVIGGLKRNR